MQFDPPLIRGTLIKREKRFLAHVALPDGSAVIAHCPNTGSMKTCADPGWAVAISPSTNPKRKLAWTLELVEPDTGPILVNTARPNRIVHEALDEGCIEELEGYTHVRPEVKYGENSRIDLLCTHPDRPDCYVEVKNVTMLAEPAIAAFPDSVSKRAAKHMRELTEMVRLGHRAVVFFLVSREGIQGMRPADEIDPAYGEALREAVAAGVEVLAYRLNFDNDVLTVGLRLPVHL